MSKQFMNGDFTPEQIKSMLIQHCESQEEANYYRDLSPEDLAERKHDLSENLIKLNELQGQLDEIKADFKARMKPLQSLQDELLEAIHIKKELITGNLYHIANHADGIMETFTEDGQFYSGRRLKPEERQMRTIFPNAVNE